MVMAFIKARAFQDQNPVLTRMLAVEMATVVVVVVTAAVVAAVMVVKWQWLMLQRQRRLWW